MTGPKLNAGFMDASLRTKVVLTKGEINKLRPETLTEADCPPVLATYLAVFKSSATPRGGGATGSNPQGGPGVNAGGRGGGANWQRGDAKGANPGDNGRATGRNNNPQGGGEDGWKREGPPPPLPPQRQNSSSSNSSGNQSINNNVPNVALPIVPILSHLPLPSLLPSLLS